MEDPPRAPPRTAPAATAEESIEGHLRTEGNRALASASRYTFLLGLLGASGIGAFRLMGAPSHYDAPLITALWGAVSSLIVWRLAHRRLLHGPLIYPVLILYASTPTLLFVASHLLLDQGAATFITGPMSYLYAVLIAISGCLLRPKLPVVVSVFTGLSLLGCYELARPVLLSISLGDPTMEEELASRFVWVNKAMMVVFVGLVTSVLTMLARRLAVAVREETSERDRIRRVFGQYVSDEVATHLLTEVPSRTGVRRDVVVLFADIRGFTTWTENAEPDELVGRLNDYFDAMVGAIHGEGGVVDKFIGDAIMSVFDGVLPHEAPEDAALRAALAMQAALAELNVKWQREGLEPWRTGIGLHRGEVVVGSIGSESRRDFTVLGDAVNTASRLEGLTKELGAPILLSEAVVLRLRDRGGVELHGEVPIRGRAQKLRVYRTRSHPEWAGPAAGP